MPLDGYDNGGLNAFSSIGNNPDSRMTCLDILQKGQNCIVERTTFTYEKVWHSSLQTADNCCNDARHTFLPSLHTFLSLSV